MSRHYMISNVYHDGHFWYSTLFANNQMCDLSLRRATSDKIVSLCQVMFVSLVIALRTLTESQKCWKIVKRGPRYSDIKITLRCLHFGKQKDILECFILRCRKQCVLCERRIFRNLNLKILSKIQK